MGIVAKKVKKCLAESPVLKRNIFKILSEDIDSYGKLETSLYTELGKVGFFAIYGDAFSIDGKGILITGNGSEGKTPLAEYFKRNNNGRYKPLGSDSVYLFAENNEKPALLQIPNAHEYTHLGWQDIMKIFSRGVERFTQLDLWVHLISTNRTENHERVVIPGGYRNEAISVAGDIFTRESVRKLLGNRTSNVPYFAIRKPHGYEEDKSIPEINDWANPKERAENEMMRYEKDVARTAKAVERLFAGETNGFSF